MIHLIAFEYHGNMLFHGDIKPDNIFMNNKADGNLLVSSDVGSLLFLGRGN